MSPTSYLTAPPRDKFLLRSHMDPSDPPKSKVDLLLHSLADYFAQLEAFGALTEIVCRHSQEYELLRSSKHYDSFDGKLWGNVSVWGHLPLNQHVQQGTCWVRGTTRSNTIGRFVKVRIEGALSEAYLAADLGPVVVELEAGAQT